MAEPARTPPPGFDDLPVEDQIDYVQALWDRVAADPSSVPVPGWHLDELRRRDADYRASGDGGESWEEVRERILSRGREG
jgi:putative addiction module component (TIGR02574 family)